MTSLINKEQCETTRDPDFKPEKTAPVTYLTLGDGDFSFSLDVALFLLDSSSESENELKQQPQQHLKWRLTATGLDTLAELRRKYKDIDSILKKLGGVAIKARSTGSPNETGSSSTANDAVNTCHAVNAIIFPTTNLKNEDNDLETMDEEKKNDTDSIVPAEVNLPLSGGESEGPATNVLGPKHTPSQTTTLLELNRGRLPFTPSKLGYDHVIFNHPHLGSENLNSLHQCFLSHLYHSCITTWLAYPRGMLHLTLVKGQAQRWNAIQEAHRHGLALVQKRPFRPPGDKYQCRRNDSGKSFANRMGVLGGSETLIFARSECADDMKREGREKCWLPWYRPLSNDKVVSDDQEENTQRPNKTPFANGDKDHYDRNITRKKRTKHTHHDCIDDANFPCPHCTKTFREQRSLKNHLKCVHLDANGNVKQKQMHNADTAAGGDNLPLYCKHCIVLQQNTGETDSSHQKRRSFVSMEALQAHIRAKHTGIHKKITPDWKFSPAPSASTLTRLRGSNKEQNDLQKKPSCSPQSHVLRNCHVCGILYTPGTFGEVEHQAQFFLQNNCGSGESSETENLGQTASQSEGLEYVADGNAEIKKNACRKCNKTFRDGRAVRQHENMCFSSPPLP